MTRLLAVTALVLSAGVSVNAVAESGPQAIDLGAFKLVPSITLTEKHDRNLYSTPSDTKDSYITVIAPRVQLVTGIGMADAALTYTGGYGFYEYDSDDNYDDHTLAADYVLKRPRGNFSLTAAIELGHDARGEAASEGIASSRKSPDRYKATGFDSTIGLGGIDSRVGVSVEFGHVNIGYLSNRADTQYRDRNDSHAAARVYLHVMPDIRFFGEWGHKSFAYATTPIVGGSLDSEENSLSAGFAWQITGKTTGDVKVGTTHKSFNDPARTNADMRSWRASIDWSPKSYSTVTLTAVKVPAETNGSGSFVETQSATVGWKHQWLERLGSNLYVSKGKNNHADDVRADDLKGYGASVNYEMRRWLGLSYSVDYTNRDSNENLYDFSRVSYSISAHITL